jgi:thiamine-phosphate pyrophosphorylase
MRLKGLYAITDEILTPDATLPAQAEQALAAGVKILQYRNKTASDDDCEAVCIRLQNLCRRYGAIFIIDDRPELARRIGADGLHIGKDDITPHEARSIFPEGIIGVSCYGSIRRALAAQDALADYVAFGSFFLSPTKPRSGIVPIDTLSKARKTLGIPICAIGGIDRSNIGRIAAYSPDMISCVSAIWKGHIARNVTHLIQGMTP